MSGGTRPDLPAVLSAVVIRSYMRNSGWCESTQGTVGSVWTKGDAKFCVPHEGDDPDLIRRALVRLAGAEGRTPEATAAAIAEYRDAGAATKDCGCGPLEPCGTHLGRGAVAPVSVLVPDDTNPGPPAAPEGSRDRTGTVAQGHPLGAAVEAVAVMEEAEVTWNLAAGGDRYRRALILSTALWAAGPGIVAEANLAAEARLAEVRQTIAAFFTHHGNSAAFAHQTARDLAEGIRQVLDRAPLETPESGKEPRP